MPCETKTALLFDLDGTLVDSLDELDLCINLALRKHSLPHIEKVDVARFIGKGTGVMVQRTLTHLLGKQQSGQYMAAVLQAYNDYLTQYAGTQTRLLPGVLPSLERLSQHYPMALVTNKPRAVTEPLLKRLHLQPFFKSIVAGDDTPHPKPAPDMLWLAANELNAKYDSCVMVGDSMNDQQAACNAGMQACLLNTGYNEGMNLRVWAQEFAPNCPIYDNIEQLTQDLLACGSSL